MTDSVGNLWTGAAIAIVSSALAPLFKEWAVHITKRGSDAKYLVARVLPILDRLVEQCASICSDDGEADHDNGYLSPTVPKPETIDLPKDVDWKSIETSLMYRILDLPNLIVSANKWIHGAAYHDFPPDFASTFAERRFQYGRLGIEVISISTYLRFKYSMPSANPLGSWSVTYIEELKAEIETETANRLSQ